MENKLPARVQGNMTMCCICNKFTGTPHYHHTIPRSLGGEDSLQIPLDADCHNNLHHKASAIVAMITSGKRKKTLPRFWSDPEAERRAEQWVQVLIQALLYPPVSPGGKMTLLPMIKVDGPTRQGLELLKKDLPGVTNLEQLLQFCINYTLKHRGNKNEQEKRGDSEGRKDKTNHARTSGLW